MNEQSADSEHRSGPLNPEADDGIVVVENPPAEPMHMTDEEADLSAIRLLDAADRARKQKDPTEVPD